MDRTRESRRSSMASSTTRRHRTITLRDSSEEGASKRGRNRERDRDSMKMNKRRRGSQSHGDEGEHNTEEESVGNEQSDDVAASQMRSPNTTSFASDHNNNRRSIMALKVTDEMIGVAVPRKARSASVKRSHESWVSVGGGGGEEQNFRQPSSSPGRHSVEPASPSSSSVSVPKKMKAIGDAPRTLKSSSSDIEIEIAELLYGLRTSKKHESSSSQKLEASIDHHTSLPPQNTSPSPKDDDKKKVEDCNSSAVVPSGSTAELVRIHSEQPASVDCHDGNATGHGNRSSESPKEDIEKDNLNSGAGCGGVTTDGRSVSPIGESPLCSKLGVDKQDSASTRVMSAAPGGNSQRVGKFEIDLMAPPPMMSPEGDDLSRGDFSLETKAFALDVEMKWENSCFKVEDKVEKQVKKEKTPEESAEAKIVAFKENGDVLKHDLEKPNNDDDARTNYKLEEQDRNEEQPTKSSNSKVEKTAKSSSAPLSTAVSGRPITLSPTGYMLPLQTDLKMGKTIGSLTTPQHVNFVLSQLQSKRCATHHYIAHNIFLHQQFTKTNPLLPAAIGSGSLCGTKPNNVNSVSSAESMVIGKQSQKHLPGLTQNVAPEKESAVTSDPSLAAIKSSNNSNPMDPKQMMQLALQQSPYPGSTGNLMGPAFLFPPGQHQASVAAANSKAGGVNSTCSASSFIKSHSLAAASLGTSSTVPAVAATMSFSYPNFSTNDTPPYVTIVQNNGYSFPFSTSLGATAAIRGASPAQTSQILNGPFYSTQIFHPLQHPQQQPHSQALIQPSYLNASTSSSSSSYKPSQGAQVDGNNILTSTTMQSQQSQKQQNSTSHPRKHETAMGGENTPSVANRTSYPQKNVQEQKFTIPVQPVNFSFWPSATSDIGGGNGGNFGDKQQQQQAIKGGVEIIPSQPFAISFAAFNGTSVPSSLNFSSMPQNPVIFHSLPDIAWQGYQAASTSHTIQQKAYSITEGKSGGNSSRQDGEKKASHGKSSTNGPTTLVFDNSSKNLNFVLSPTNENWPSRSIASTAVTSVPLSSNASSSPQPSQLLQLQKQHGMQQQQPAMATRYKASSSNTTSATKFANSAPAFSHTLTQCKSSTQGSHSKSSGRTIDSHVHHTSSITSNTPSQSYSQEQGRVSQGRMQISFGGNYITPMPPNGQQLLTNNQPLGATVAGTPLNGGNLKPNSEGRKVSSAMNTSQLQQTENSTGSGQKSSPVCGRNVPSILSSCPGHLSELKF